MAEILSLPARPESLEAINEFVSRFCEAHEILAIVPELQLVLEELVMNVYMHGRIPCDNEPEVEVSLSCSQDTLYMKLSDNGKPFDPLGQCTASTDLPIDERAVGGLGIILVREIMDEIDYHYANGLNQLCMRKWLQ